MLIHISGINEGTQEREVRAAFGQFGEVDNIKLFGKDGYGYIVMGDETQARAAAGAVTMVNNTSILAHIVEGVSEPVYHKRVWARRPFNYGGVELNSGQVFTLEGCKNDVKLIGLRYVIPFEGVPLQCVKCHLGFNSEIHLLKHICKVVEIDKEVKPRRKHRRKIIAGVKK